MTPQEYSQIARDFSARKKNDYVLGASYPPYAAWVASLPEICANARNSQQDLTEFNKTIENSLEIFEEFFAYTTVGDDEDQRKPLWRHQKIDLNNCYNQNFPIHQKELHALSDAYLASVGCRCDILDWCFLDALIYSEVFSFIPHCLYNSLGMRRLWVKNKELLQAMLDVYAAVAERTINPRLLKERLDRTESLKGWFHPAVFVIADQIYTKNPTLFVRPVGGV
jgi:hypothetical protein